MRLHVQSPIQDTIEKEIVVQASKDRVCPAITTPEQSRNGNNEGRDFMIGRLEEYLNKE